MIVAEYRMHETNTSRNSELMLTTTLQVLKSQARYFATIPTPARVPRGRSILAKTVRAPACVGIGTFLLHFATNHLLRKLLRLAVTIRKDY